MRWDWNNFFFLFSLFFINFSIFTIYFYNFPVFSVANLDEAQCREAVLEYVAQHCCYGKGCAEKHVANQIEPSTALRVSVKSNMPLFLLFFFMISNSLVISIWRKDFLC